MLLMIQPRPLTASIRGGGINESVANGTSVGVTTAAAIVIGGYPPYVHDWTDDVSGVSVQTSATVSAVLQATGTDVAHTGTIVYVVTDARGTAVTASAVINVNQGTPP